MIREMNRNDITTILEMGKVMHDTTSYKDTDWCPLKVAELCINLIKQPHMQAWIAETSGEPVGMFFGIINEHYFGSTLKSNDLLLYVIPKHRSGSHAYRLVNAYIEWAQSNGVQREQIGLGITTEVGEESIDKFYIRMGFERTGRIYNLR